MFVLECSSKDGSLSRPETERETGTALSTQTMMCSACLSLFYHHFRWTKRKTTKQSTTKAANTGNIIQYALPKKHRWKKEEKPRQISKYRTLTCHIIP